MSGKGEKRKEGDLFRKLHRQMTWFCTLVTGVILVSMTLFCLVLSENVIRQNHRQTFQNDLNSVISYLESQSVISHQWLAKAEGNRRLYLALYDNGEPLLHNSLSPEQDREALILLVRQTAGREHGLDIFSPVTNTVLPQSVNFTVQDDGGQEYYAAAAVFPKQGGALSAVAVYPLRERDAQIASQRLLFAAVDLLGLAALAVFAWHFAGRMLRPLEESRKKQAQFVAAASHELRSPLAVMLSNLSALGKAEEKDREQFEENIRAEGSRMSRLVDDMLALANADSHSWSVTSAPTEMDTLALNVYERFLGPAKERKIRLEVTLPEGAIPRCECDGGRVEQALSVLLDNALCYTPSGGKVLLTLEEHGGNHVKFTVLDTGPGVPDADKERIFERFYRADSARRDREHFGLGLCIAREIAELHGGKLWVEDVPGGGAAFCMIL